MPVTIEVVGVDEVLERLEHMQWRLRTSAREIVKEIAPRLKRIMQDEAPERTGALKRGIHYRTIDTGDSAYARFYDDQEYAFYVVVGTAAHDIYPTAKKALFWEGAEHPVAHVFHPGTKPDPFPERAMERMVFETEALLDRVGESIVQGEALGAA